MYYFDLREIEKLNEINPYTNKSFSVKFLRLIGC